MTILVHIVDCSEYKGKDLEMLKRYIHDWTFDTKCIISGAHLKCNCVLRCCMQNGLPALYKVKDLIEDKALKGRVMLEMRRDIRAVLWNSNIYYSNNGDGSSSRNSGFHGIIMAASSGMEDMMVSDKDLKHQIPKLSQSEAGRKLLEYQLVGMLTALAPIGTKSDGHFVPFRELDGSLYHIFNHQLLSAHEVQKSYPVTALQALAV
ncbi:uncharacterized protein BT62DRAFT_924436 [Guyanagaster necrorhizus]|uniref:Uncharacterized protein n=1 Tax=Guyanagaster necrorhizus TaxID=856835 RepID=A0A9P8ALP3_9AGAR|nr:uncharacterized protein BT62DRAFT_924436 [Guyanagaster necrorhizus MCA 3950]KAG7439851.1 hypothetical protein BT62DRAFT_924436 [Guyanagaster necrorhizus MCA 3950]